MIRKITTKSSLIALLCLVSSGVANAQITLQATNIPSVGDQWVNKVITDTTIQAGSGGAGAIWDFTAYFITVNTIAEEFKAVTGSGDDVNFPTANMKVVSPLGWTDYFKKSSAGTELQWLGFKGSDELYLTSVQNILTVPFTYNTTISNVAVSGTAASGATVTGTVSVSGDGYGTLKVAPGNGGPFNNVLRVKFDINLVEDYSGGSGTAVSNVHIVRYSWYRSGLRAPVFSIIQENVDGILGSSRKKFVMFSTVTTGVEDLAKPSLAMEVYPNPAKESAFVKFSLDKSSDVSVKVMDITGKVCLSETAHYGPGEYKYNLGVADFPRGIYVVSVTAGAVVRQQRLILSE